MSSRSAHDRYGPLPVSVLNLADYGRIRVMADRLGIESIDREGRAVVLKFRPQAKVDPVRLDGAGAAADRRSRSSRRAALRLSLGGRLGRRDARRPSASAGSRPRAVKHGTRRPRPGGPTRAREGEVKPGFNKEAILRPAKEDPRAAGGVFERVGGLLSDLLDRR